MHIELVEFTVIIKMLKANVRVVKKFGFLLFNFVVLANKITNKSLMTLIYILLRLNQESSTFLLATLLIFGKTTYLIIS